MLLRRRRLQAGRVRRVAQHRLAVEAPDRLRDGEQQLQRRHALRAGGRQRRRRRAAGGQGEGVQHARRDRRRRRPGRGLRGGRAAPSHRARAGDGPTLVESKVYRLSAHGNIIAPPGVPLHYPEHEAIRCSGAARSTRRRCAATRCRASGRGWSSDGMLDAEEADAIAHEVREEMQAAVEFGLEEPVPGARGGRSTRLRLSPRSRLEWHARFPTSRRSTRPSTWRWRATTASCTSARTSPRPTNDPFVKAFGHDRVRVTPISETAEIGMAVGAALAGYRPVVELYMAEFMLVAMDQVVNEAPRFRYMSGGQVKVPLVLKAGYGFTAGWAGQHTGSIYGMFMGVPGLKVVLPSTPADAKGLMATAIRDDNPVVLLPSLPADARARRGARGRVPGAVRRGGDPPGRRRRDDRRHRLDGRPGAGGGRDAGRRGHRGRGDRPAHARPARHGDDPRVGREDRPAGARRPGDAPRLAPRR